MIKFNIIVPSQRVDYNLKRCVQSLIKIDHPSFIITIVLDEASKTNDLKEITSRFENIINILISGKINISSKRNLAAKKYNSKYLAFIDSDALAEKNWLQNAEKILDSTNEIKLIGGPSGVPLDNQKFSQNVVNLSKRSFFSTGIFSRNKFQNETNNNNIVESCNMFVQREAYLVVGGMNEELYIAEDFNLCRKIHNSFGVNSVKFYHNLLIKHEDRDFINFNLQRFAFGTNFLHTIKELNTFSKIITLLPLIFFLLTFFSFFLLKKLFLILLIIVFLTAPIIFIELLKFKKGFKITFLALIFVYFANFSYVIGNIAQLLGLKSKLQRKVYSQSKR